MTAMITEVMAHEIEVAEYEATKNERARCIALVREELDKHNGIWTSAYMLERLIEAISRNS